MLLVILLISSVYYNSGSACVMGIQWTVLVNIRVRQAACNCIRYLDWETLCNVTSNFHDVGKWVPIVFGEIKRRLGYEKGQRRAAARTFCHLNIQLKNQNRSNYVSLHKYPLKGPKRYGKTAWQEAHSQVFCLNFAIGSAHYEVKHPINLTRSNEFPSVCEKIVFYAV